MNTADRESMIQAYIEHVVNNMTTNEPIIMVWERMEHNFSSYSDEEVIREVADNYPEIMEDYPEVMEDYPEIMEDVTD